MNILIFIILIKILLSFGQGVCDKTNIESQSYRTLVSNDELGKKVISPKLGIIKVDTIFRGKVNEDKIDMKH